jgi:hypothetical protein
MLHDVAVQHSVAPPVGDERDLHLHLVGMAERGKVTNLPLIMSVLCHIRPRWD